MDLSYEFMFHYYTNPIYYSIAFAQTGVKEYWMIDPENKEIYVYSFKKHGGAYEIKDHDIWQGTPYSGPKLLRAWNQAD